MEFTRYALYYTAPTGDLADFGAAWLGWDMVAGSAVAHPDVPGLPLAIEDITKTPRKYGFHATIKPPFRLADGVDAAALRQAVAGLCSGLSQVTLEGLVLTCIGRFLALTPLGDTSDLAHFAASIVRELDRFRAPLNDKELARRRAAKLSAAQEKNLVDWGYPYVLDEFRFHMTLSGKLDGPDIDAVHTALNKAITPLVPKPFGIGDLTLAGEAMDGQFYEIERFSLSGAA